LFLVLFAVLLRVKSTLTIMLEYASTVWSPHTVNTTNQTEAVQRRAARSEMNDWSRPYSQSGRRGRDVHLTAKEQGC